MVGPDGLTSSTAAGAAVDDAELQRRLWNHDEDENEDDCEEETTAGTAADVTDADAEVDVDVVQLLTRRLSVTPPTDVHSSCPDVHERRQTTTGNSAEVDFNPSYTYCLRLIVVAYVINHEPPRSTQPFIPPGQVNRVPACLAGVKAGCVHLCRVTGKRGNI